MRKKKQLACILSALTCTCFTVSADDNSTAFTPVITTKQTLLAAKNAAVNRLAVALETHESLGPFYYTGGVGAIRYSAREDFALFQVARQYQLEATVQGIELLEQYRDKTIDMSKRPDHYPDANLIFGPNVRLDDNSAPISTDMMKIQKYRDAITALSAARKRFSYNLSINEALGFWEMTLVSDVHHNFLSQRVGSVLADCFKQVQGIIDNTAKNPVVKVRLTQLVNKLKSCSYELVRQEVMRGKILCLDDKPLATGGR